MDDSNGYEGIASGFIKSRGQAVNGIGASTVRNWVRALPANAAVLDLGCGTGIPVSKVLMDAGMTVYGIDASPTMVRAFRHNFPHAQVACEAVENSSFFNRQFDAIVACGLLFLLPKEKQEIVVQKAASALDSGGRLLFTAPSQSVAWQDAMTGKPSLSLGAEKYMALLAPSGLALVEELEDEGQNHYYHAVKA
jgi:SAM-dependent methyltransferase